MAYDVTGLMTNAVTKQLLEVTYVTYQTTPSDTSFATDASVEGAGYFNALSDVLDQVGILKHIYVGDTITDSTVTIYGFSNAAGVILLDVSEKEVVFT